MHQSVTIVAKYFLVLSALLAFWTFIELPRSKKKEFVLLGIVGGLFTVVLAKIGSHFFYDTRPFVAGHFMPYFSHGADNGFPSDHTLLASFLSFLVIRYSKRFGTALFVLAILIGAARVIAGVHHTVDIIGSFACSSLGFGLALLVTRTYLTKSGKLRFTKFRE